jgi:hypothetical protein
MDSATLDVISLTKSLAWWERGEYVFTGLVVLACAGEYVASFTSWFTGGVEERKKRLEKLSTLLLVVALALELLCLFKTNSLTGQLVGSLSDKAAQADEKARTALTNSTTALNSASTAIGKSNDATASASGALTLAKGARKEADSFEQDIVTAKTQAASAESHLTEAMKRAADANAELDRIKTPRSLLDEQELVSSLSAYKDTEYMFLSVFGDEESINLLKQIDDILQHAGWKRAQPSNPNPPAINVPRPNGNITVTDGLINGVEVSVEYTESVEHLQSLLAADIPAYVRAGVALNLSFSSNLSPVPDETYKKKVNVVSGKETFVRISVGKKPT